MSRGIASFHDYFYKYYRREGKIPPEHPARRSAAGEVRRPAGNDCFCQEILIKSPPRSCIEALGTVHYTAGLSEAALPAAP